MVYLLPTPPTLQYVGGSGITREDLSIDVSITNVDLIATDEAMVISFFGVRAERRTDRQTRFWNPHMETCRHTKNFNSKLKISG